MNTPALMLMAVCALTSASALAQSQSPIARMGLTPGLGAAPELGALPGSVAVPGLGALPGQAPVVNFTPLAEQEAGGAAPALAAPAAPPAPSLAARARQAANTSRPAANSARIEHALFERRPVAVALRVDRERLVRLPFAAMLDVPPNLVGVLEAQIIEDTVYLTALEPIKRSRLLAHALDGSAVIPLDLSASATHDPKPELEVHLPGAQGEGFAAGDEAPPERPDMVQLTRYAAQALYAPRRLVEPVSGVRQSPVSRKPVVLYRDAGVATAPLGAWTSGELFVTAVRFTNASSQPLELDMERLRGRWLAATPQHWRLLPQGSEADTTVVYLVSEQAFDTLRED